MSIRWFSLCRSFLLGPARVEAFRCRVAAASLCCVFQASRQERNKIPTVEQARLDHGVLGLPSLLNLCMSFRGTLCVQIVCCSSIPC